MRTLAYLISLLLAAPTGAFAQSACRPSDREAEGRLWAVRRVVAQFPGTREAYKLPVVPDSEIVLIADPAVCQAAAAAYNSVLPAEQRIPERQVHVIRVGSTRFVIWDPTDRSPGEDFDLVITTDTAFVVLAKAAS
jgi:hypothetical protein